jgi:hypothetical protein
VVVVEQALRLLHRLLPVAFGCSYCYLCLCALVRKRVRQVVVNVSALVAMFYGENVTLLVEMV